MKLPTCLFFLGVTACATGTAPFVPGGDDDAPDAAVTSSADADPGAPDAEAVPDPDAMPPAPAAAPLLLTEVVLAPTEAEYVELANPTDDVVALDDYYLADAPGYFRLPAGAVAVDSSDFIARFPAGATLAPGAVITVALSATPTFTPTYSLAAMTVLASSGTPTLTNGGELVALFFWDGATDRVQDVDLVNAGNAPSAANTYLAKTAVDGPDVDTDATAYATDAPNALPDMETDTPTLTSYKRIAFEAGNETQAGTGNGITGDDETSEAVRTTWDSQATAANYTAGTPGTIPAALQ